MKLHALAQAAERRKLVSEARNVSSNSVRVLVAVSHRLYLEVLCRALTGVDDIVTVAETTDAQRAIELAMTWRPDVAVVDLVLWKRSEPELVDALHANGIGLVVLCPNDADASPDAEPAHFCECPSESVSVGDPFDVLIEVIRTVGSDAAKRASRMIPRPDDKPISVLTKHEVAVLRLVAEGFTTKEIANKLHVSVRTVGNHRLHLSQKLEIRSASGLARYAVRHGVVSP